ncbi:MAG TPA: class I SAM-dependent methyltransferase [Candidatus Limnocylindrales bacterium]|jgi:SAM-dependent methyltransferase|nr:class I SAM-dependent methyltransferase [Candidatus Limnocylindrales bacterium]
MQIEKLSECTICHSAQFEVLDEGCNITRCAGCGYIFDNPRPAAAELVRFYSNSGEYDGWLQDLAIRDRMWKRRLRIVKSTGKTGSLLDVGTGIGQFLDIARPFYSEVYGTEVSSTAVAIAREKYGLSIFEGTLEELKQQALQFDNISMFHVLEHVPDPRQSLATCHALLSDGGILMIAVPNEIASLRGFLKRILRRMGFRTHQPGKLGIPLIRLDGSIGEIHLSHFTPGVLRALLERSGFSVIKSTLDPYYLRRSGWPGLKKDLYYYGCLALHALFRVNLFDAMLLIAKKRNG